MESPLLDKSLEFASQVVLFYEEFSKRLPCGTMVLAKEAFV